MKNNTCSVDLINEHSFDDSVVAFRRSHNIEILAKLDKSSPNVLRNKLTPGSNHKLSGENIQTLSVNGNDVGMIEGLAMSVGYGIYKIEESESESSMLHCVLSSIGASANITNLYDKALADGQVDESERNELLDAVTQAERKLKELRAKLTVKSA